VSGQEGKKSAILVNLLEWELRLSSLDYIYIYIYIHELCEE